MTSRWGSCQGIGRSSTAFTTLNIRVLAPIPIASTATTVKVKPGLLNSARMAVDEFYRGLWVMSDVKRLFRHPRGLGNLLQVDGRAANLRIASFAQNSPATGRLVERNPALAGHPDAHQQPRPN